MKLKLKTLQLNAGKPIAFINSDCAEKLHVHEGDRIELIYRGKKLILVTDTMGNMLNREEIGLSDEAFNYLGAQKGDSLEVTAALEPESILYIIKKFQGKPLTRNEIHMIIRDIASNALNEPEIAYFVSAVYNHGMSLQETVWLTDAMAHTGKILHWHTKKVADKHSIGGIPNNRTTPIIISICAAAGIVMPKTSSRAITTASATADTMEVITNVIFSASQLKKIVEKTNACLAWGGSLGLAPADDMLIRVERLLNVDPESQLVASILSKKIAAGSTHVLIDIPCGEGAKVSKIQAKSLGQKFIKIGSHFGLHIEVVATDGSQPIGNGVGPILEMKDVLSVLAQKNSPKDLQKKSLFLAGKILEMMNFSDKGKGEEKARLILESGEAYKKFQQIVSAQGRKNISLNPAQHAHVFRSGRDSKICRINNKSINLLARVLGCPADIAAGLYLHKHVSESVKKNDPILTLYAESPEKLKEGMKWYHKSQPILLSR